MNDQIINLEQEIKQLLSESQAENTALKKLIAALKEQETRKKAAKRKPGGTSQPQNIQT